MKTKLFLKNNAAVFLWAVVSIVFAYFVFGFYYERYEPFPVFMFSGVFTPGMIYDDLFYLAYIGLAKIFGNLYYYIPDIPWISIFQYTLLLITYVVIGKLLLKRRSNKVLFWTIMLLFSIFYMEFYVLHVMTRIAFLLSFVALLKFIYNFENKERTFRANIGSLILFILGILIRAEPSAVAILIMSIYYFVLIDNNGFVTKVSNSIKIFLLPALLSITALAWVMFSAKTSDEFFIKIEPDVEYELMVRNNMVPLDAMTNEVDSMRYEAIYEGLWGDATLNDEMYLRSLIAINETSKSYLIFNAIAGIKQSAEECMPVVVLNLGLFFLLMLMFYRQPGKAIKLLIFQSFFYLVIFVFGYKTKMTVSSVAPLMLSVSLAYLLLFLDMNRKEKPMVFILISISLFVYQFVFINEIAQKYKGEYIESRGVIEALEESFPGKNLFLDNKTIKFLYKGFKPFQRINFRRLNKLYLFDSLYVTTVQPYKKYLIEDCSCDPNNYKEYFNFILQEKDRNVFFVSKERIALYENYLSIVHNLNTSWSQVPYDPSYEKDLLPLIDCGFFKVESMN